MSGILTRQWFTGTSHNNDSIDLGRSKDALHVDVGFLDDFTGSNTIGLMIIDESCVCLSLVEILKHRRRVPDDKGFIDIGVVDAGDSIRSNQLVIGERNWLDRRIKCNAGDIELGIAKSLS